MEGAVGRPDYPKAGRLQALGLALLFTLVLVALVTTGVFLIPALRQTALPAGDGMPAALIGQFALILAAALAATWILRTRVERREVRGLGFPLTPRAPRQLGGGVLIGLAGMAVIIGVLSVAGVYRWTGDAGGAGAWAATVVVSLAAFAIPAAAEEVVFRGYLLETLGRAAGPAVAVVLTSILFAVVHGGNPEVGPFALANLLLAGVLLAIAVLRTGALWLATGVHLGWNWAMAGPLDLPVSGLDPYDAPFYDAVPAAPAWLSGGAFGPEGGLAGTAAAMVVLGLVLWLTRPGAPLALAPPTDRRV